jgi:hypothetical protein
MRRDRKWILARWAMGLGTTVALTALVAWLCGTEGAPAVLMQGLGTVGAVLGLYGAANVAQKGVVGKHYRRELDKEA